MFLKATMLLRQVHQKSVLSVIFFCVQSLGLNQLSAMGNNKLLSAKGINELMIY